MYKAIIFDMDGTLIDSNHLVLDIYQTLCELYPPRIALKQISKTELYQKSYPEILNILYQDNHHFYMDKIYEIHEKLQNKSLNLYPGAIDMLTFLKSKNMSIFLLTSEVRNIALHEIKTLNIDHFFDEVITYDDVSIGKPHPEGILKILDHHHLNQSEVLMIGDSPSDGIAAKSADISSMLINWYQDDTKTEYFDYVCQNFDEVKKHINSF